MVAVITLADTPRHSDFLYCLAVGELSSNHCALADKIRVRSVAATFLKLTIDSQAPVMPKGSPYTSVKPLTKSTRLSRSLTHAIAYSLNFCKLPDLLNSISNSITLRCWSFSAYALAFSRFSTTCLSASRYKPSFSIR